MDVPFLCARRLFRCLATPRLAAAMDPEQPFPRKLYRESVWTPTVRADPRIDVVVDGCICTRANHTAIVVLGASGDVAKKKIYPAIWCLFRDGNLPPRTMIYGYARTKLEVADLAKSCARYIQVKDSELQMLSHFWQLCRYQAGSYDKTSDYENLEQQLGPCTNRIFYLALPSSVFTDATNNIKRACMNHKGWTRIVLEKPFGSDAESYNQLSAHLANLFTEDQIYCMDHYLGKEMVQSIITLRFGNRLFNSSWNNESILSVGITLKEKQGTYGRGGYFDQYGIIRDVMQNHLLQILGLLTMNKPLSRSGGDTRDEKVRALRCVKPVEPGDVLLGQYVANPALGQDGLGYKDDSTVPADSTTATFAVAVLWVKNERWEGVPFILRCGKALDEDMVEIVIHYKPVPCDIFGGKLSANQLVIRVQPKEAVYLRIMTKTPGLSSEVEETVLDLTYSTRYPDVRLPDAYTSLLLDLINGTQVNFAHLDEIYQGWRIFTPVLQHIDNNKVVPIPYKCGSRGPQEATERHFETNIKYYGVCDWDLPADKLCRDGDGDCD